MRKISVKALVLSVVVCLLPILAGVILYSRMPEQIPIHWGFNGQPDNFTHKALALFGLPMICALVQAIICFAIWRSGKKIASLPKMAAVCVSFMPPLTILLYAIILSWALDHPFAAGNLLCAAIGLLLVVMGNYFPKISYEDSPHLLYPTKFKSESSFRRTMKIYSIVLLVIGFVCLILAFFV